MIHGDPSLADPRWSRCYQEIEGVPVEVFPTPFIRQTQDLANECFVRFARTHNGKDLDWNTPRRDQQAAEMIRSGFPLAIKEAERHGPADLAQHFRDLMAEVPSENTFQWLFWLAADGCGRRPPAPVLEKTS